MADEDLYDSYLEHLDQLARDMGVDIDEIRLNDNIVERLGVGRRIVLDRWEFEERFPHHVLGAESRSQAEEANPYFWMALRDDGDDDCKIEGLGDVPDSVLLEMSAVMGSDDDDDEPYDDSKDHQRCPDCKGSGWYVGLHDREYCPTCDGSGWL